MPEEFLSMIQMAKDERRATVRGLYENRIKYITALSSTTSNFSVLLYLLINISGETLQQTTTNPQHILV
jgi:hypothetical protein